MGGPILVTLYGITKIHTTNYIVASLIWSIYWEVTSTSLEKMLTQRVSIRESVVVVVS